MHIIRITVSLLFLPSWVFCQEKFIINGELHKMKDPISGVYLFYVKDGARVVDSADVKLGKYQFSGNISQPVLATLRARYASEKTSTGKTRTYSYKRDISQFFLEPDTISIANTDSFGNFLVKGSASDIEYRKLDNEAKPYYESLQAIYNQYSNYRQANDQLNMNQKAMELTSLEKEMKEKVFLAYAQNNPESPVAFFALEQYAGDDPDLNASLVEPVFNKLPEAARKSSEGQDLWERIARAKITGIGSEAMDFTQEDTAGNPVKLSSFRGRYLLLDFWASWCGPCRAENPNVVRVYEKYRQKGFDILGVSLDKPNDRLKWLNAIRSDQLNWTQVSDLQYWNNAAARQYGIQSIPQNFLLDPTGHIIAKNLRGDALDKKLAEIFSQQ